ncbi:MAG: DUF2490 domain-containing protein [Candidatus Aureabacteria bacterium]|nr:DUF2490 domain-containing protein [Candidatus Auribacterota bacterium]
MRTMYACTAILLACAALPALGADDWQMWNTYGFKLPVIKKKLDLNYSMDTRFRDDMDEFFRYHFYIGPDYHMRKWLTLGIQYGNIQQKPVDGEFQTEHRIMYFVTPKFKLADLGIERYGLGDLNISFQNRLDQRIRHYADHTYTWRYRIYPKLSYPVYTCKYITVSPYVADAFYFDFTDNIAFSMNRLYSGLNFKVFGQIGIDFYYMRLAERSGRGGPWNGSNVLGTGLAYEF